MEQAAKDEALAESRKVADIVGSDDEEETKQELDQRKSSSKWFVTECLV